MKKKASITQKDFKLLLSFLNEENEGTLHLVKDQLKSALKVHPRYKQLVGHIPDPRIKKRAQHFVEELRLEEFEPEFAALFEKGRNLDLEQGVYLLAKLEYPNLSLKRISGILDKFAEEVDQTISSIDPVPTRPVNAMQRQLFKIKKFKGDEENYNDPENLFFNKVLSRKKGIPITLSCLYLFVAWRLKLLAHGIGLPGHFLVGHRVPRGVVIIDAFHKGRILRAKDCEVLVRRLGIPFRQSYMDPATNIQILSRMVVNLINMYNDQGQTQKAQWLARLFQLLQ